MQKLQPSDSIHERKINVAIADDHNLVRQGLTSIINAFEECSVIIEASNGRELIDQIVRSARIPDVCILDISMPRMDGYMTLIELKKRWPRIRVLVLTIFSNEYSVIKMLQQGAGGYLLKDVSIAELRLAINSIFQHGYYLSEMVSGNLIQSVRNGDKNIPQLKEKEMEFLKLCSSDFTYRQIASIMNMNFRTIEGYRDRLFLKFKVSSRIGLVLIAMQIGILSA